MNQEQITKLELSIENMKNKKSRIYLISQDTKGNAKASMDEDFLRRNNIVVVFNCTKNLPFSPSIPIKYRIPVDDNLKEEEIRNMSASAYAAYAPGIMAGRSLASQTSALKQTYANLYGVDPDTVQYNTKGFMKLLQYVDPKTKQPVPIPIWEAEKLIKSEEDWLYTPTARDDFDKIGYGILKEWNLI